MSGHGGDIWRLGRAGGLGGGAEGKRNISQARGRCGPSFLGRPFSQPAVALLGALSPPQIHAEGGSADPSRAFLGARDREAGGWGALGFRLGADKTECNNALLGGWGRGGSAPAWRTRALSFPARSIPSRSAFPVLSARSDSRTHAGPARLPPTQSAGPPPPPPASFLFQRSGVWRIQGHYIWLQSGFRPLPGC